MRFDEKRATCDRLVVGGTLASHLFSYLHNVPLVSAPSENYLPFEKIGGHNKEKIFNSLSFILSLGRLKPFSGSVTDIFWEDENRLRLVVNNRSVQEIAFKELLVFEPDQIKGLSFKHTRKLKLIDQFHKVFCEQHNHKFISNTEDEFLKELHFVGQTKIYGTTEIEEKESGNEKYSEYLSKFKLRYLLEKEGLGSGISQRRLRFDHVKRIKRLKYLAASTQHNNVKFVFGEEEKLWNQIEYSIRSELSQSKKENPYLDMLGTML
jgi:hypothetical protein